MKLENLFENQEELSEIELKCWNWIIAELIESEDSIKKKYQRVKRNVLPYDFFLKHRKLFSDYISDEYMDNISIEGNILTSSRGLVFYNAKKAGPVPFKIRSIAKDFQFTCDRSSDLIEIPAWFPEKSDSIEINVSGITTLSGIAKVIKECRKIEIYNGKDFNKLPTNWLDLFQIKNLQEVYIGIIFTPVKSQKVALEIVNKHLNRGRDVFECQEELIDAGFEEYAQA